MLLAIMLFASCQHAANERMNKEDFEISSAMDNPCIQCTQQVQIELASCLHSAGSDQSKKDACNTKAAKDWTEKCGAICKPSIETSNDLTIEIGAPTNAEKSSKSVDSDVKMTSAIDGGVALKETCSGSGHLRKITVNGVCYSQMCCGGQWMFFYKDVGGKRVWCTCNLGESWTVSCDGNNWIVGCR